MFRNLRGEGYVGKEIPGVARAKTSNPNSMPSMLFTLSSFPIIQEKHKEALYTLGQARFLILK